MHGREGNRSKMMAASVDLDGNVLKPMKVARTVFIEDSLAGRHGCSKRGGGVTPKGRKNEWKQRAGATHCCSKYMRTKIHGANGVVKGEHDEDVA